MLTDFVKKNCENPADDVNDDDNYDDIEDDNHDDDDYASDDYNHMSSSVPSLAN